MKGTLLIVAPAVFLGLIIAGFMRETPVWQGEGQPLGEGAVLDFPHIHNPLFFWIGVVIFIAWAGWILRDLTRSKTR